MRSCFFFIASYLQTVQLFLTWAAERYLINAIGTALNERILALKDRIRSNFDALYLGGRSVSEAKGLNDQDMHALLLMLHPSASSNPFRRNARIRNWLIFRLFAEAGPRRGELLKLKTTDLVEDGEKFFVTLRRLPDDPSETRAIPPAQKTLPRTIGISKARETATWQHENPGRLWDISPQTIVSRSFIHRYVGAAQAYNLDRRLKELGVKPVRVIPGNSEYLAGDIENLLASMF